MSSLLNLKIPFIGALAILLILSSLWYLEVQTGAISTKTLVHADTPKLTLEVSESAVELRDTDVTLPPATDEVDIRERVEIRVEPVLVDADDEEVKRALQEINKLLWPPEKRKWYLPW